VRGLAKSCLSCVVALLAAAASAQPPDPSSREGAVLAAEGRRYKAMIAVAVDALEPLLADELRFTHANGNVEAKYEFIASLESGNLDYQAIETSEVAVRVLGEAAIVTGVADLQLVARGNRSRVRLLYTAVYVERDGAWRLLVYQSTRHPQQR
jgi:hypothetical protein